MKKKSFSVIIFLMMSFCAMAQNPIYDASRQYDIVTDADTFYLFSPPKPCIHPAGSVVIEYLLPENVSIANLLIMNNYGQTIANRTIYSNNEQESVHNLKEGTYMVLLVSDGLLIGKKVLVVY